MAYSNIDNATKNHILEAAKGILMDVVKKYDLNLTHKKGEGHNYDRGTCPKCNATEALVINTVKEAYFCKGCGFKGIGAANYLYHGRFGSDKTKWVETLHILADFTNTIIR